MLSSRSPHPPLHHQPWVCVTICTLYTELKGGARERGVFLPLSSSSLLLVRLGRPACHNSLTVRRSVRSFLLLLLLLHPFRRARPPPLAWPGLAWAATNITNIPAILGKEASVILRLGSFSRDAPLPPPPPPPCLRPRASGAAQGCLSVRQKGSISTSLSLHMEAESIGGGGAGRVHIVLPTYYTSTSSNRSRRRRRHIRADDSGQCLAAAQRHHRRRRHHWQRRRRRMNRSDALLLVCTDT